MNPLEGEQKVSGKNTPDYSSQMFWFALELIPYFGVPAILGLFLNKKIETLYPKFGIAATATIFFVTYSISWVIVVLRYRSIKRLHQK